MCDESDAQERVEKNAMHELHQRDVIAALVAALESAKRDAHSNFNGTMGRGTRRAVDAALAMARKGG